MERIPMTASGYKALEEEINQLKNVERHAVIAMIAEARAHGDLSENAEYHAAKERQSFIDQSHRRAEFHGRAGEFRDVDHIGPTNLVFQLDHTAFNEGLAFFGSMIFGVFRKITVGARFCDHGDHRMPLDVL